MYLTRFSSAFTWIVYIISSNPISKYQLYAEAFQICISRSNCTLESQTHIYNCLPAISTWRASGCLIVNISKTELFYFFCLISILFATLPFCLIACFQVASTRTAEPFLGTLLLSYSIAIRKSYWDKPQNMCSIISSYYLLFYF